MFNGGNTLPRILEDEIMIYMNKYRSGNCIKVNVIPSNFADYVMDVS